jgi:hypothetical protein
MFTLASASLNLGFGQKRTNPTTPVPTLLNALPAADAVALVKVRRLLDEALPKLMAGNPAKLNEALAQIEQFKTRTGIDPRSFNEMALGLRFSFPGEGITKVSTMALASGSFNAGALAAAGRIAANGKYREQQYQGKTIYIFTLDQQLKILGLFDFKVSELAVSPLDAHTLALGDVQAVQNLIDVKRGRKRVNADIIALASKDPNAIVGFGANVSPELHKNLSIGNDTIARDLTAVRQVYGSVGLTATDLEVMVAARTVDEFAARNLGNTIEALKQFGGLFVNRLPAAKAALAKSALGSMKITNQGNDLQIKTSVAQSAIAPLVGG